MSSSRWWRCILRGFGSVPVVLLSTLDDALAAGRPVLLVGNAATDFMRNLQMVVDVRTSDETEWVGADHGTIPGLEIPSSGWLGWNDLPRGRG